MKEKRPEWDRYFLELARMVASRSTCIRRQVGAVLVRNERIVSTGYNGAPRGIKHCIDWACLRESMEIPSGHRYELCRGVHAEQNAIINAAFYGVATESTVLFCTEQPCMICTRMIINAGIIKVVYCGNFQDHMALELFKEADIDAIQITE